MMLDMNMYEYLVRDAEEIMESDAGVAVVYNRRDDEAVGFDLRHVPPTLPEITGNCIMEEYNDKTEGECRTLVFLDSDYVDELKSRRIRIDHEAFPESRLSDVRRPYYMIRGKSISYEQVKHCLKSELQMFQDPDFFEAGTDYYWTNNGDSKRFSINDGDLGGAFPGKGYSSSAWMWDTGEIGGSGYTIKYPEFDECMPQWLHLALKYPFLDMVIGYTTYPEMPCCSCPLEHYYNWCRILKGAKKTKKDADYIEEIKQTIKSYQRHVESECTDGFACQRQKFAECSAYFMAEAYYWNLNHQSLGLSYRDIVYAPEFMEDIVLTVRIHEGNFELISGERAVKEFQKYDREYGFQQTWRYATTKLPFYYDLLQETLITETTLRECFAEKGMDPDKCMEYLVRVHELRLNEMKRGTPQLK